MVIIVGVLALTASAYIGMALNPDEFLDLALACQDPISPVLSLHLDTNPFLPRPLKTFHFNRGNLLTNCLR